MFCPRHPGSYADPFSAAYFDDPFPVQSALRDAGPMVRRHSNTPRLLANLSLRVTAG
jgi:hypothetical protein